MKNIVILLVCLMCYSCSDQIIYKSSGEDTLYIDTENPIKTQDGVFVLSTNQYYNILQDSINNDIWDVVISKMKNTYVFKLTLQGNNIIEKDGNISPFYIESGSFDIYRTDIVCKNLPRQFFVLCKDDLHYCKVILDSLTVNSDTTDCSAYFHYTLNLEPNDTRF